MSCIERMDSRNPGGSSSIVSGMFDFVTSERDRLRLRRRFFNKELSKTTDPSKRDGLRRMIQQNEKEKQQFEESWKNSSVRRGLKKSVAKHKKGSTTNAEYRINQNLISSNNFLRSSPQDQEQGQKNILVGYGAVFNKESLVLWSWDGEFIEIILPGCFTDVLKDTKLDCCCLYNHTTTEILGRSISGSLQLAQDDKGLKFECELLSGDALSDFIAARVRRGDISRCSFCFVPDEVRWKFASKVDGIDRRYIIKVKKLYDVSPVINPAFPDTSLWLRGETNSEHSFDREQGDEAAGQRIARLDRKNILAKKETERKYAKLGRIIDRVRRHQLS